MSARAQGTPLPAPTLAESLEFIEFTEPVRWVTFTQEMEKRCPDCGLTNVERAKDGDDHHDGCRVAIVLAAMKAERARSAELLAALERARVWMRLYEPADGGGAEELEADFVAVRAAIARARGGK